MRFKSIHLNLTCSSITPLETTTYFGFFLLDPGQHEGQEDRHSFILQIEGQKTFVYYTKATKIFIHFTILQI